MPSALEQAGSRSTKQNKYAPIHTNRFFTGLWTNRNALRDAATPYLYEKFYSGSRFESLIDGSNMELSGRLTLFRRAGNSVYNSQLFPAISRFFSFEISNTVTSTIKVIADTAGVVFDATGPNTKTNLFNKAAGSVQTSMESVGNTLYMGDGAEEKKWVQSLLAWLANTQYNVGDFLVDASNNLQIVSGIIEPITRVAVAGNVLTVTVNNSFPVGAKLTFSSVATATFLNGITVLIVSRTATAITANLTHADYASAVDTGSAVCSSGSGSSGAGPGAPAFSAVAQTGTVTDNQLIWNCKGSSIQAFQAAAATDAPSVVNAALASLYKLWAANTWYSPSGLIVDNQGTPAIQKLTTAGTTGGVQPTWNVGGVGSVTNDNSAQWTNKGQAAWQAGHVYAAGDFVAVTYTVTIVTQTGGDNSGDITPTFGGGGGGGGTPARGGGTIVQTVTYTDFFKCTTGGTSSNPGPPAWATGVGTTVPDNTVIWTNQGAQVLWTSASDGPGAAKLVSIDTAISDTNGNIQNVIDVGTSGAVAPTWATAQGSPTTDGTITWSNGGPSGGKANTGAWTYCYAPINDVTGDIGTASPISAAITQAANSYIQVQGNAFTDTQVGKIRIYRTAQGGSFQLKLADIPNPLSGTWTYADVNADGDLNKNFQAAQNGANNPPPSGLINLAFHVGRMFGSVGNVTYYSAGAFATEGGTFKGVTSWPPGNTITWKSKVLRHVTTAIGLLVFTKSGINIITGDGVNTPLKPSSYLPGIGILSYNAVGIHGSLIYVMDARRRVISLDPSSGVSRIGLPIADKFKQFDPAASYLTYHTEDDTDEGLYVADGSTGWFRLNPTPAPETGMSWSPKATIVGGCKAVQTLEVAPGLQKMLLGPIANGPILARDLTTNQDNGANYADCFAVLGSIVLAQSGTMAQLEFIAMELPRIGSRATVQVRLNEIGGPFYGLKFHGRDPQYLPQSTTLFADRFYFSATQKPAYCRHMQIKFSFPQENVQNEVLTYTIFGAILKEK